VPTRCLAQLPARARYLQSRFRSEEIERLIEHRSGRNVGDERRAVAAIVEDAVAAA